MVLAGLVNVYFRCGAVLPKMKKNILEGKLHSTHSKTATGIKVQLEHFPLSKLKIAVIALHKEYFHWAH